VIALMRLSFQKIQKTLFETLIKYNFNKEKAKILANIFTESSLDGVYSHGLNRFPRFIQNVKDGIVQVDAVSEKVASFGNMEQWNGRLGPGILNAILCMERAIEMAAHSGMGCVALANTNHWMRGGSYGWQAADKGFVAICWTNTMPNMVPWGGTQPALGNNPFVIAIPRKEGHIVLDMAMSQYSFGKMQTYAMEEKKLPFPGGWDNRGTLTLDPEEIINNEKALPIGYWKGSALSFVLDVLAALLSNGDPTCRIGSRKEEYGLSQVFIAFNVKWLDPAFLTQITDEVIQHLHLSSTQTQDSDIFYPGERTLKTRKENQKMGVPVDKKIWLEILNL
jgi:3-dehydro-L-gulonate 2-dehydrogenase